jgi:membrane protein DedA with SNARE-associated domain
VFPIVPSELCVIIGGVAAATGSARYGLWYVIACGAIGAFLGDHAAYHLGRTFAGAFERRAHRKEGFRKKLHWAQRQLETRGGPLLITARFMPGGRTALTVASGITRQRRHWFAGWIAVAAAIWATYAAGLAYIVGKPFENHHGVALGVAFATAVTINLSIEAVRHVRKRRSRTTIITEVTIVTEPVSPDGTVSI